MPYTTTWQTHGIVWTFTGVLTGNELLHSNFDIFGDERFDDIRYQIVDLTAVEKIEVTAKHMRKLAHLDMAAARSNPKIRVAVVTTSDAGLAITQTYDDLTAEKSPWVTKVFSTREAAEAWVKESRA